MKIAYYIRRAASLPPDEAVRRALRLMLRTLKSVVNNRRRRAACGYARERDLPGEGPFVLLRDLPPVEFLERGSRELAILAGLAVKHRFDLLGSGWVHVAYGMAAKGVEGHCAPPEIRPQVDRAGLWLQGRLPRSCRRQGRRFWQLVSAGYDPIPWHLDFKSGHGWPGSVYGWAIRYGAVAGADVKVPWELGRMQHLPLLAWAALSAQGGLPGFDAAERYSTEIYDQINDFMALNPPGYGVQWACPMDVAIRIVNWLVSWNILQKAGVATPPDFASVIRRGAVEHARFLIRNLEWNDALRGNHYLCDLVGLIWCAAHLPSSPEADGWLSFGIRGLIDEIPRQFHPDGSNFEASTSYHRLSAEAVILTVALIFGLPEERLLGIASQRHPGMQGKPGWVGTTLPLWRWRGRLCLFPADVLNRVEKMADVTLSLLRGGGTVPQFGDNDNGRLLKLWPAVTLLEGEVTERGLDHRHLLASAAGLFGRSDWLAAAGPYSAVESAFTAALSGFAGPAGAGAPPRPEPFRSLSGLGVHLWRRSTFDLAVRCGDNGQNGFGGHAHCDALALELVILGDPVIVDAGTYLYTPLPERRHQFRSASSHNTLVVEGRDQNRAHPDSLFHLLEEARPHVIGIGPGHFQGAHSGYGEKHIRTLEILDNSILGSDLWGGSEPCFLFFLLHPAVDVKIDGNGHAVLRTARGQAVLSLDAGEWQIVAAEWSPGYGQILPTAALRTDISRSCSGYSRKWEIRIQDTYG